MQINSNLSAERAQLISDWARFAIERLQKNIDKFKIGVTGSLKYSLLYALKSVADGDIGSVQILFNYYGKFVDMGLGKGVKIESVSSNSEMYSAAGKSHRKPKKWLSKTLYGEINQLQLLLLKNYSEQVPNIVRESIQQNIKHSF